MQTLSFTEETAPLRFVQNAGVNNARNPFREVRLVRFHTKDQRWSGVDGQLKDFT